MERVLQKDLFFHEQEDIRHSIKLKRYREDSAENSADSSLSNDEATEASRASPKKIKEKRSKEESNFSAN